jgi:glycosyltransferase involved in cell wall biosynthesis
MEFINKTNNTVHLEDIKIDIPYLENDISQKIDINLVKKSECFRRLIILNQFIICDIDNSIFERSLLKIQKESKIEIDKMNKEKEMSKDNVQIPNKDNKLEVRIRGHFYEAGGYAKVNRNLALGLSKLGVKVQIDPITMKRNELDEEEVKKIAHLMTPVSRKAIMIDSIIPTFGITSSGKYKILYTTIEADTVPQQFIDCCNMYNEVWVTSDHCKKVLLKYNIRPKIEVVTPSIDTKIYKEDCKSYEFEPKLNDFIFISVFGWNYRKGYDVLLKSYIKEFTDKDNVSLLIVSRFQNNSSNKDIIKNTIQKYIDESGNKNPPHIARFSNIIPENIMPNIYKACNVFFLPTRGEGFGLIYCEASLCGLPIISTNFSGQTMYLKDDNSYLIEIDKLEKVQPGLMNIHYWNSQIFPSLTSEKVIDDTGKLMRYVFNNYDEAKTKNIKLKSFIQDNYNINNVSYIAKNKLDKIWSKIKW